jgi:DNA-directed RNA polymerase beta subunit
MVRPIHCVRCSRLNLTSAAFDAIVRGEQIGHPHTPAAFNVLVNQLRGLSLDVRLDKEEGERPPRRSRDESIYETN